MQSFFLGVNRRRKEKSTEGKKRREPLPDALRSYRLERRGGGEVWKKKHPPRQRESPPKKTKPQKIKNKENPPPPPHKKKTKKQKKKKKKKKPPPKEKAQNNPKVFKLSFLSREGESKNSYGEVVTFSASLTSSYILYPC